MLMVEETGTSEFEGDYTEGLPDALTDNFFTIDSTVGYFPVMRFTEMYTPIGGASPYCLHIDWNRRENRY